MEHEAIKLLFFRFPRFMYLFFTKIVGAGYSDVFYQDDDTSG